jgi:paraquat-inducible protein A
MQGSHIAHFTEWAALSEVRDRGFRYCTRSPDSNFAGCSISRRANFRKDRINKAMHDPDQVHEHRWVACPECEAPCRDHALPPKSVLKCGRCGVLVKKRSESKSLQRAWAMATAGLFFVVLANVNPILTFDVVGNTQSNLIVTGVFGLFKQGYWPVAGLVLFAGIAGPALHLASVWYLLAACCLRLRWPGLRGAAKMAEALESWNLVPVYAIATVVAVVKLDMLGTVAWQKGALWVLALSLCSLLTMQFFDRHLVEDRLEALG